MKKYSLESQNSLTKEDIDRRKTLKLDLLNVTIKETQYWAQIEKRLWINEGEENTNFFPKVCSARRREIKFLVSMIKMTSIIAQMKISKKSL